MVKKVYCIDDSGLDERGPLKAGFWYDLIDTEFSYSVNGLYHIISFEKDCYERYYSFRFLKEEDAKKQIVKERYEQNN